MRNNKQHRHRLTYHPSHSSHLVSHHRAQFSASHILMDRLLDSIFPFLCSAQAGPVLFHRFPCHIAWADLPLWAIYMYTTGPPVYLLESFGFLLSALVKPRPQRQRVSRKSGHHPVFSNLHYHQPHLAGRVCTWQRPSRGPSSR